MCVCVCAHVAIDRHELSKVVSGISGFTERVHVLPMKPNACFASVSDTCGPTLRVVRLPAGH